MRFLQILNEAAADYAAMINPVLAALRPNPRTGANGIAVDLADEWRKKISAQWETQISLAKTLKKADRITWYLRLSRAAIIDIYAAAFDEAKLNKLRTEYVSRVGKAVADDSFAIGSARNSDSIHDLEHYLSLPIAAIQNYQFRFQPFDEVLRDFQRFEDKWRESVKDTLEDDHATVIVDCGNDWFWVDTEKAYCSKEAAAMGHCGNAPRQNSSDHLLSLRKRIMFGAETRWQPHLTFILADDGFLTEMKGKNNDKPVEKYFPMIIKLLESDTVKGIRGGGYMPENNFAMADLDEADRARLIELKPELGSVSDLFDKYGASDIVFNRIDADLQAYRLTVEDWEGDTVVLETWDGLDKFFRNGTYDNDAEKLAMMGMDGDFEGWMDNAQSKNLHTDDLETIIDMIIDSSDGDVLGRLAAKVGTRKETAVAALLHMFPNALPAIFDEVVKQSKLLALDAATKKATGMRLRCYDERLSIEDDGTVKLTMEMRSLAYNIASYQESDYDTTDGFEYCAQDGSWLAVEDDADEYYGNDDEDESSEEVTADTIYEKADKLALELIMDLFDGGDENQMAFDF